MPRIRNSIIGNRPVPLGKSSTGVTLSIKDQQIFNAPFYTISVLAIGGGGGGGGGDGGTPGAAGGNGGIVYGNVSVYAGQTFTVQVGGGGYNSDALITGGGSYGARGASGTSGSGGYGGGWSGVYIGGTYYFVAGGGAGGGGAAEGSANDVTSPGGGNQPSGANGTLFSGGSGAQYQGDGGGGGGGGGGYYGGAGQTNLSGGQASGGGNYTHPSLVSGGTKTNGTDGPIGTGVGGGIAAPYNSVTFTGYNGTSGRGGSSGVTGTINNDGVVIIRYPGGPRGTGGNITQDATYTYHTFNTTTSLSTYIA